MASRVTQAMSRAVWALASAQHGVVTRAQLLELGFSPAAIQHRIDRGRLFPIFRGVYAVGWPYLEPRGCWMAAVLSCGPAAVLSHVSAAALWGILDARKGPTEISLPHGVQRRRPGITTHRRSHLRPEDITEHDGIPVTRPVATLVDIAACGSERRLARAIGEADKLDLLDTDTLRRALDSMSHKRPGVATLKWLLDRPTFAITDSDLERLLLAIIERTGLPRPIAGAYVNGFKVDFYFPHLGLIIEADGLRYHRTPLQQEKDMIRDNAHAAAGLLTLRFTHHQITKRPEEVEATIGAVAAQRVRG
jgi:hypothetical protein